MSGKVMKKLRKQAYQDSPTNSGGRRYKSKTHVKKIEIPAEKPGDTPTVKLVRSVILLCTDNRVQYQQSKRKK